MGRHSVQPRDRIFVKDYEFLCLLLEIWGEILIKI